MMDLRTQIEERLDPTALHFKSLRVEGFRVIKSFHEKFEHHNIITGMNGVGKTTMLQLLAGVAGNDRATDVIAEQPVGEVEVVLGAGNEEFCFRAKDRFDRDTLVAFKESLPEGKRANYALTDYYYERFQCGEVDYDAFREQMEYFFNYTDLRPTARMTSRGGRIDPGSGVKNAIKLLMLAAMRGGPLLLDHPEISLDSRNKSLLSLMVMSGHKQTITVTHAPEWGANPASKVEKRIEMSF